jgi:hypothetical protein
LETSDTPLESLLDMRIFDKYDSQKERKVSKKAGALYAVCVWEGGGVSVFVRGGVCVW